MSTIPPHRELPLRPSLEFLRKEAKELARQSPDQSLGAVQHRLAKDYGFMDWAELTQHVEERIAAAELQKSYQEVSRRARSAEGDPAEVLSELLAYFDTRMKAVPSMAGVRSSFLLGEIHSMGKSYPPALVALRERQAGARAVLTSNEAWSDYHSLCRVLGENEAFLDTYDQAKAAGRFLPTQRLMFYAFLPARRYVEAAAAQPLAPFLERFDQEEQLTMPGVPEAMRTRMLTHTAAELLEAYAGAGDMASAKLVLNRALKRARTQGVIDELRKHAARAGHPELLEGIDPG